MKKKKIAVALLIVFILICGVFSFVPQTKNDYRIRAYSTRFTEAEHIQRITARTVDIFEKELTNGTLVDYEVNTVYSFYDNAPRFFVVELEFAEEIYGSYRLSIVPHEKLERYKTKYRHLLGYIRNDTYYIYWNWGYSDDYVVDCFMNGRSPYKLSGYPKNKKYFGKGIFGVEKDGEILKAGDAFCPGDSFEFHVHWDGQNVCECTVGGIIAKETYKELGLGYYPVYEKEYIKTY